MEERPPEVPQPIPEIPKQALLLTLGIPPVAAMLAGMLVGFFGGHEGVTFLSALACILTTVAGLGQFDALMARRYRGNSAVFLSWAYILGQMIVCAALGLSVLVFLTLIGHSPR